LKSKTGPETQEAVSEASYPPRTTLPRIQLPQFSGKYEEWHSFRDLFFSIIRKDTSTLLVEKLHYLKSCLKGEVELLVRSLPTTDENFDRAWKALLDYYDCNDAPRMHRFPANTGRKLPPDEHRSGIGRGAVRHIFNKLGNIPGRLTIIAIIDYRDTAVGSRQLRTRARHPELPRADPNRSDIFTAARRE